MCPACGAIADDSAVIVADAKQAPSVLGLTVDRNTEQKTSPRFEALFRRYADAYKAARFIVGLGRVVKVVSIVLSAAQVLVGLLIFVVGVSAAAQSREPQGGALAILGTFWVAIFTAFWGVLFGVAGYIIGVFVSAAGQIQRATLDTAVNSSPHLTNGRKLRSWRCPKPPVKYGQR